MSRRRIAFYGGSFDPPHVGHYATILYALQCADVDRVVVAPVYRHPDGKRLAPYEERVAMLQRELERLGFDNRVCVSFVEQDSVVDGYGTGLTVDTLKYLRARYRGGAGTTVLVLGSDIKASFPNWAGADRLQQMVDDGEVEVFWVDRVDGASSTKARDLIAAGLPTDRLLPAETRKYIDRKGLYRSR